MIVFTHTTTNKPHELVLSIRWDKADAALRVKLAESHTLVESAVIDGYRLLPTTRGHTQKSHTE